MLNKSLINLKLNFVIDYPLSLEEVCRRRTLRLVASLLQFAWPGKLEFLLLFCFVLFV